MREVPELLIDLEEPRDIALDVADVLKGIAATGTTVLSLAPKRPNPRSLQQLPDVRR
jgi:hypothetical protein